jgi:hypothetical protein
MPQSSSIDRFPTGRRNEIMERLSRNALRVRGRSTASGVTGRQDSLEALVTRLGAIPTIFWKGAVAGDGYVHVPVPPQGGQVTVTVGDGSLPASHAFSNGTAAAPHTFTTPSIKQTLTSAFAGNANTKGRAAETV